MRIRDKGLFIVQLVVIAFFLAMVLLSFGFENRAGIMPKYIGLFALAVAVGDIALSMYRDSKNTAPLPAAKKQTSFFTPAGIRLGIVAALMIAYLLAMYVAGYIISTLLMVFVVMQLLGVESVKLKILGPTITTAVLFLFFQVLLKITLPLGLLFS